MTLGFLFLLAALTFLGAQDDAFEQTLGVFGITGQPVVEMVAHCGFNQFGGILGAELFLGLPLELRIGNKDRQHDAAAAKHVFGGDGRCLFLTDHVAIGLDRLCQGIAETGLVCAAKRGRDGVTV